jgi:hypothetical protein
VSSTGQCNTARRSSPVWRGSNSSIESQWKGLGADSEEKHEPVSDINTLQRGQSESA